MDEAYQRLVSEVTDAGGHLELPVDAVAARLHVPGVGRDAYALHVVKRRLAEVGLTSEFRPDGRVLLTRVETPTVPAPASAEPPAAPLGIPASPASAASSLEFTADRVGNWLFWGLVFVCTFFPAIGHQLVPGGDVGDKQDAFFAIYFATFPLSLAATFIFLMLFFDWFDSEKERALAAAAAIVGSAIWGIGFGTSYADMEALSHVHGNLVAVIFQVVGLALFAYATYYGWALFIAGWVSSLFAAFWIREKVRKVQALS